MTNLVDTLLRLSRGDAGTIRLSRGPVDLGQLAREVAGVARDSRGGARSAAHARHHRWRDRVCAIVWCCGRRSRTCSTTRSSTARRDRRITVRVERSRGEAVLRRSRTRGLGSRLSTASASSIASSASTKRGRATAAAPGWGWRLPSGRSRCTAGRLRSTEAQAAVPNSESCCRSTASVGTAGVQKTTQVRVGG